MKFDLQKFYLGNIQTVFNKYNKVILGHKLDFFLRNCSKIL